VSEATKAAPNGRPEDAGFANGAPKDDGWKSRKLKITYIGGGLIFLAGTAAMGWSLYHWSGVAGAVAYVTFDQWADLVLYVFATAVLGYGLVNNGEKWILTRNGIPPAKPKP
jgi:hypothetical protein